MVPLSDGRVRYHCPKNGLTRAMPSGETADRSNVFTPMSGSASSKAPAALTQRPCAPVRHIALESSGHAFASGIATTDTTTPVYFNLSDLGIS